jgi:cation:H+ antiporter
MILNSFLIIVLFLILSKSASVLVNNLQAIIAKKNINPILIGLILGFFTTLPEITLGFNAISNDIKDVSLGNIWGGIILLFTLVLGLAIVFHKNIKNDGKLHFVLPAFLIIIISFLLSFKSYLNYLDGLIIILLCFLLVYYEFFYNKFSFSYFISKIKDIFLLINYKNKHNIINYYKNYGKQLLLCLVSIIVILISSYYIIEVATKLLVHFNVSTFIIGLLVFSIGTNLPEIVITIRSIINKAQKLSFSHLIGSALNSVLALGILSLFTSFNIEINNSFLFLFFSTLIVLLIVLMFYITKKTFDFWEGLVLLLIYFIFVIYQFI